MTIVARLQHSGLQWHHAFGGQAEMHSVDRTFGLIDQQTFAEVTGDWNPIHIDPIFARRTVAGAPVVHGVHLLLWALDCVAQEFRGHRPTQIRATFDRFVLVGQAVSCAITRREDMRVVISIKAENVTHCSIDLVFKDVPSEDLVGGADWPIFSPGKVAIDRPVTEIDGLSGHVPGAAPAHAIKLLFPHVAMWLGADIVADLGTMTRIVGMVCPGLHSIFKALRATLYATRAGEGQGVRFTSGAPRHGLVNMKVTSAGLEGLLTAVVRPRPQPQPTMRDLTSRISPDEFCGDTAIVIGASRGLGEVTAKILAAAGAHVLATWSEGAEDAERVADEIRAAGGRCTTLRYRVGEAAEAFRASSFLPSNGYYFAAPTIARSTSRFFDGERLRDLQRFFVDGFWEFADQMRARCAGARLFYPSTVYIENWPNGLAEYAMAKATGEILCAEINARHAPLTALASRLPRLPSDQTAGLYQTHFSDPIEVLLPLIRRVQRG